MSFKVWFSTRKLWLWLPFTSPLGCEAPRQYPLIATSLWHVVMVPFRRRIFSTKYFQTHRFDEINLHKTRKHNYIDLICSVCSAVWRLRLMQYFQKAKKLIIVNQRCKYWLHGDASCPFPFASFLFVSVFFSHCLPLLLFSLDPVWTYDAE